MSRSVVLIGAAPMAEGYLQAAERLGLRVGLVETAERAGTLRERYGCVVDTAEVESAAAGRDDGWIRPTEELVRRMQPDGVLASSEIHVLAGAMAQEKHRLPGPGLDAAAVSRDKGQQRFRFAAAGLAQPQYLKTSRLSGAADWAAARLPVVVKPLNRAGSDGVERIGGPAEWADAVRRRGAEGPLLVEEYVEGQEFSWEGLVTDGRVCFGSLTRKLTTGAPDFVELAHFSGHERIDPVLGAAADTLGQAVADAVRMRTGVMFVEFRTRGDELVIMEMAVRAPGDRCMDAMSLAYGRDLFAEVLELGMGSAFREGEEREPRYTGSCFLVADRAGVLRSAGEDTWSAWPGVARYGVDAAPGATVGPPRSSADRLAWALLDCPGPEDLADLVDRLRAVRPVLAP
ncbi:ATP-grasp domain-containing protein [Streptomyces sp. MUM 203J]|uniref:ATP-grasp domain-containing protein n=1 Tax=Streptomyces sp. MUM 203J TaxID=2791990 RepID=UPI001F03B137|nr:ATP-grasp domain-containing protein [Streptomyces sp. MUM 203J]MCH0538349.1 ATP-grasp domain-containing protein [Streptomyces sp. MUM 203J]